MPTYKTPLDDMRFVLHEVLNVESLSDLPGFEEATADLIDAVLEEGAKVAENELQPLNRRGDEEGCVLENGVVRTPDGFKEAYRTFIEGGWTALGCDPDYGGQGLPQVVNLAMEEMMCSANMSFSMYPGLSRGAYDAIEASASNGLKDLYLPKLADGTWSGTMCLTEPQCGTDLGLIRTTAAPNGDGSYAITGTKIFISAGEHDLTENIVHLVLARLPDAPEGIRGISMFLVPKFLPQGSNGDVRCGPRNGVACGALEHKMGIKASATCVMNFDQATGWLVGQPHKGMRAMFVMMNAARLAVGIQGLAQAEAGYQNARDYARDRQQGRSLAGVQAPDQPADPIIVHPDVRRNLLRMKAFNEGARALAYWVGMEIDKQKSHPDPQVRQEADDLVALMTPIIKSYFTDMGFEATNLGVQILGGHGYIREWGMEQFVRDARITQLYEGANGIQALDLVGRKLPMGTGRLLRRFFHPLDEFMRDHADDPVLGRFVKAMERPFGMLQKATATVAQRGLNDAEEAGAAATDYLRLFALVALGFMWLRMVKAAAEAMPKANGRAEFYDAKIKTARFFFERMLPEGAGNYLAIMAGKGSLMALDESAF